MSEYNVKEPPPVHGSQVVTPYAIEALEERAALAVANHGCHLMTFNGRDAFMDYAQEVIDAIQYQVQGIEEMRALVRVGGAEIGDVSVSLQMYQFVFKCQLCREPDFYFEVGREVAKLYLGTVLDGDACFDCICVNVPAYHGPPAVLAGKLARFINERMHTWQNS